MAFLLFLNDADAAPLGQPWRGILIFTVIFAAAGIPLALALLRLRSRTHPRHLRIPYADRDALIYQVTEILKQVGFVQGPAAGQAVMFEPTGPQKLFGMAPIELLFDRPGAARLTVTHAIMRRIAHIFRGATEEKYTGPNKFPLKGFAIAFGGLLGVMAILIGAVAIANNSGTSSVSTVSTKDLDVEQVLNITVDQARRGAIVDFKIAHTGMPFSVHVPAKSPDGTKLYFHGMGKFPPQGGPSGDFYLRLHIE